MNHCFAVATAPFPPRHRVPVAILVSLVAIAATVTPSDGAEAEAEAIRETFSVEYTVEVRASDPTIARVRWDLAGIDEIRRIQLTTDAGRFSAFQASGRLEEHDGRVIWWPSAPYGHLSYTTPLRHRRGPEEGFDSWADTDWVLTRARHLFPHSRVLFATGVEPQAEARARLIVRVPDGWDVASPLPPDGLHRFIVESPRARFDHPRGWLMLGRFARTDLAISDTMVSVATAGEVTTPAREIFALLRDGLPKLEELLARRPTRLLIALAPDPMWRGGLSGSNSFYMHGDRPIRTPDRTSPYLHELFHVINPTRPGPDAAWVTEGLAEFYSVEIQRRIGTLDPEGYRRALRSFARHGLWRRDFTRTTDFALRNNSAPLVMWALDHEIRQATDQAHTLDDVVTELAQQGGTVTTARFLGTVRRIADTSFNAFFRRHVYRGEQPSLASLKAPPSPASPDSAPATPPR